MYSILSFSLVSNSSIFVFLILLAVFFLYTKCIRRAQADRFSCNRREPQCRQSISRTFQYETAVYASSETCRSNYSVALYNARVAFLKTLIIRSSLSSTHLASGPIICAYRREWAGYLCPLRR